MEYIRILIIGVFMISLVGLCVLSAKVVSTGLGFGPRATSITLVVGLVLPLLFILAMTLGRSGGFTILSQIISVLSAITLYVIASALLLAILIGVYSVVKGVLPPHIVSIAILSIGFLCGIIGTLQTRALAVREYTIENSSLPNEWDGLRAVLVSDTHYGTLIQEKSAQRVVSKIASLSPEIIFHAGDLFDGPTVDGVKVLAPWSELTKTTPVFYATGNHEAYGAYDTFVQYAKDAGFTVVHDTPVSYKGVSIAGIPYINKKETQLAQELLTTRLENTDTPRILINHHPAFLEEVERSGAFLMVSGHTHRGQFWPIRYIVRAVYGKYFYGKHQYNNLTTLTTSGTGFSGIPQKFLTPPEIVLITFKK